jgi:hypothetical protein
MVETGSRVELYLKHGYYALLEPLMTFIMSQCAQLIFKKISTKILINSTTILMAVEVN